MNITADFDFYRSLMQVGGVPDGVECIKNWNYLSQSGYETVSEDEQKLKKYLAQFYGSMSAPPDWSIVEEYFRKDDEIDVCSILGEVKGKQHYISTNFQAKVMTLVRHQSRQRIVQANRVFSNVVGGHAVRVQEGGKDVDLKDEVDALDWFERQLPAMRAMISVSPSSSLKRMTPSQIAGHEWKGRRLMKHFPMTTGRPNALVAYAGQAKTWLAVELAIAVAAGRPTVWGGIPILLSGPVVHWDYEMGVDSLAQRYQRVARGMGVDLSNLSGRPAPTTLRGKVDRAMERHAEVNRTPSNEDMLSFVNFPPALSSKNVEPLLTEEAAGKALFLVDSFLAATVGGKVEENSSEMRKFLDMLLRVSDATKCVFVVLHHERKGAPGDQSLKLQTMRGSSAIADGFGSTVHLERAERGFKIVQGKVSMGKHGDPVVCALEDVGVETKDEVSEGVRVVRAEETVQDRQVEEDAAVIVRLIAKEGGHVKSQEDLKELIQRKSPMRNDRRAAAVKLLRERGSFEDGDGYRLKGLLSEDLLD